MNYEVMVSMGCYTVRITVVYLFWACLDKQSLYNFSIFGQHEFTFDMETFGYFKHFRVLMVGFEASLAT